MKLPLNSAFPATTNLERILTIFYLYLSALLREQTSRANGHGEPYFPNSDKSRYSRLLKDISHLLPENLLVIPSKEVWV